MDFPLLRASYVGIAVFEDRKFLFYQWAKFNNLTYLQMVMSIGVISHHAPSLIRFITCNVVENTMQLVYLYLFFAFIADRYVLH